MRMIRKINLALGAVVGVSALLNFAVLDLTVSPSFAAIERDIARRNQERVEEAIRLQESQVAHSVQDYAFWDDTFQFLRGERDTYVQQNINADALRSLGINYFAAVDGAGRVVVDRGYDFTQAGATPIALFGTEHLPAGSPFLAPFGSSRVARSGLMRTTRGIAAVAYAPVLTSEQGGPSPGTLVFARLLDQRALTAATRVHFTLVTQAPAAHLTAALIPGPDRLEVRSPLIGLDGAPFGALISWTSRAVTKAGDQAIRIAMALLLVAGLALIVILSFVLRRIAVKRIETMRSHLARVADTGELDALPADPHRDELSETVASFNRMARQLADLRESLRVLDYRQGAADQAAGLLHNVRNALSPIGTIAWDLARNEEAPWKENLAKAIEQLEADTLDAEREAKLRTFVSMSAARFLAESRSRLDDLKSLRTMLRHVDTILKEHDEISQAERRREAVDLFGCLAEMGALVARRAGITLDLDIAPRVFVEGYRATLDQVFGNILLNAAEAIEAAGTGAGRIRVCAVETVHEGRPALDVCVSDTGEGIEPEQLGRLFEKGYSTRRSQSSGLGLHWCANALAAMGGRLHAESAGRGAGATLHVVLARAADAKDTVEEAA